MNGNGLTGLQTKALQDWQNEMTEDGRYVRPYARPHAKEFADTASMLEEQFAKTGAISDATRAVDAHYRRPRIMSERERRAAHGLFANEARQTFPGVVSREALEAKAEELYLAAKGRTVR